jgi:hypothetical protein
MPDIPKEAVEAATEALKANLPNTRLPSCRRIARDALKAALPSLAAQARADERAQCIAELQRQAARLRAAPAAAREKGEKVTIGVDWKYQEIAMGLEEAASVLARRTGDGDA